MQCGPAMMLTLVMHSQSCYASLTLCNKTNSKLTARSRDYFDQKSFFFKKKNLSIYLLYSSSCWTKHVLRRFVLSEMLPLLFVSLMSALCDCFC